MIKNLNYFNSGVWWDMVVRVTDQTVALIVTRRSLWFSRMTRSHHHHQKYQRYQDKQWPDNLSRRREICLTTNIWKLKFHKNVYFQQKKCIYNLSQYLLRNTEISFLDVYLPLEFLRMLFVRQLQMYVCVLSSNSLGQPVHHMGELVLADVIALVG